MRNIILHLVFKETARHFCGNIHQVTGDIEMYTDRDVHRFDHFRMKIMETREWIALKAKDKEKEKRIKKC